jgi:Homeodomain-like domain
MANAARYFDLVREMKDAYNHRLRLVESAKRIGLKPTARLFTTTVPTVRKWLRRFQQHGPCGLREQSRARHQQPHKTPRNVEAQVLELRKTPQEIPAQTRSRAHQTAVSAVPANQRRYQGFRRHPALLAAGAAPAVAGRAVHRARNPQRVVVLGLRAIPQRFGQRRIRFTHSATPGSLWHLAARSGLADRNGGEFKGDFPKALGDSQHVRIPPAAHTYQSDVETVHRLEEDEFFDLEDFSSRGEFLAKVHTYQLYFNLARPNSHQQNQSPWQIIERLAPRSPLELCLLPPVVLDYCLNDAGGHDVPGNP